MGKSECPTIPSTNMPWRTLKPSIWASQTTLIHSDHPWPPNPSPSSHFLVSMTSPGSLPFIARPNDLASPCVPADTPEAGSRPGRNRPKRTSIPVREPGDERSIGGSLIADRSMQGVPPERKEKNRQDRTGRNGRLLGGTFDFGEIRRSRVDV